MSKQSDIFMIYKNSITFRVLLLIDCGLCFSLYGSDCRRWQISSFRRVFEAFALLGCYAA